MSGNSVDRSTETVFTIHMTKNERIEQHTNQGHEVWVRSGIVLCDTCDEVLDTSGHRPGLVEANQTR